MTHSHFNKKIFAIGLGLFLATNFLAITAVYAAPYVPLAPLPGTTDTTEACPEGSAGRDADGKCPAVQNAGNYIKGAFNLAIGIAAALAIIMIILGGIQYMGSESLGGKSAGRKRINDAVLGLLLALGSYLILFTINPSLVDFNVNIGAITPPAGGTTPTPPPAAQRYVLRYGPLKYLLTTAQSVTYSFSYVMRDSGLQDTAGPYNKPEDCKRDRDIYVSRGNTTFLSPCAPDKSAATNDETFDLKPICETTAGTFPRNQVIVNCVEYYPPSLIQTKEFSSYNDCIKEIPNIPSNLMSILPLCAKK